MLSLLSFPATAAAEVAVIVLVYSVICGFYCPPPTSPSLYTPSYLSGAWRRQQQHSIPQAAAAAYTGVLCLFLSLSGRARAWLVSVRYLNVVDISRVREGDRKKSVISRGTVSRLALVRRRVGTYTHRSSSNYSAYSPRKRKIARVLFRFMENRPGCASVCVFFFLR